MKKTYLVLVLLAALYGVFTSCTRNKPETMTITPNLTATIGNYKFVSSTVIPSVLDTQRYDTSKTLVITANVKDNVNPNDKIILSVSNFKYKAGTWSIVKGDAGAIYYHQGMTGVGVYGIVSITDITSNTIKGYFNFHTNDSVYVANGTYEVGRPDVR